MHTRTIRSKEGMMRPGTLAHVLTALSAFVLSGCMANVEQEEPADEVGVATEAVLGGSTVTRIGVVALSRTVGSTRHNCSGVLLNRYAIVTAAHCFHDMGGGQTKRVKLSAVYKQPNGANVCLTRGAVTAPTNTNPRCVAAADYDVFTLPGWNPGSFDAAHDFAVLKSVNVFDGVSPSDYAVVDVDQLSNSGRLEFYGYGVTSNAGTGDGILRVGAGEIDAANPQHINLMGGGARTCDGDSGGPATLYFSQTAPTLVVEGVMSNSEVSNPSDVCAKNGLERFSRVGPKMDFVAQKLGTPCPTIHRANRLVRSCFSPPKAFRSRTNSLYVQASNAGDGPLIATAEQIGTWETFELLEKSDGTTSFVALANHKLVTAENAGGSPLIARATEIGDWEKFRIANITLDGFPGNSIRAVINNNYVAAEDEGRMPLIARTAGSAGPWEQFFFETVR